MPVPLYQAKAEFFRMLGHPVRIRVLELLQDGPMPVRDLLAAIEVEPSTLSQQLAVLRRSGIVASVREGPTVVYELSGGEGREYATTPEAIAGARAHLRRAGVLPGAPDAAGAVR
ncbi:ArsR/SmtB family transcription factor [Streptomyces sp. NPDC058357]|uniref:ArsR/SmtB family transcription factor n=1 Tax=unclassified Streptomyces TaxID=2593676 RepID=UPI00365E9010